jgi:hypothetical protein
MTGLLGKAALFGGRPRLLERGWFEFLTESAQYYGRAAVGRANIGCIDFKVLTAI